jgi:hypothetical protein
VAVPRAAFDHSAALKLFMQRCCPLKMEEQYTYVTHETQGLSFADLTSGTFTTEEDGALRAFLVPAAPDEGGHLRTRPLGDAHLQQIFGATVEAASLAEWNRDVTLRVAFVEARETCTWANRKETAMLLMNHMQRLWLVEKGILPEGLFDLQSAEDEERSWPEAPSVAAPAHWLLMDTPLVRRLNTCMGGAVLVTLLGFAVYFTLYIYSHVTAPVLVPQLDPERLRQLQRQATGQTR